MALLIRKPPLMISHRRILDQRIFFKFEITAAPSHAQGGAYSIHLIDMKEFHCLNVIRMMMDDEAYSHPGEGASHH